MSSDELPTAEPNRVILCVNPMAGSRSSQARVQVLVESLQKKGLSVHVLHDLDEMATLANQWHRQGLLRALVGVGGDGTAAELVNRTIPGVPITLLAAGTENLLAKHVGLPQSPELLAEVITQGQVVWFDAGKAGQRTFLLMFSCGFDAEVVRHAQRQRGGHIRYSTWFKSIFRTICRYSFPEIQARCEGAAAEEPIEKLKVRWLFAFNLPCYARGLPIAPDADGTDGLLDICTFRRGSLWHGLRFLMGILRKRHHRMADCLKGRYCRLKIDSTDEVPYQLDGDPGGLLPVEVEVLPRRFALLVPSRRP